MSSCRSASTPTPEQVRAALEHVVDPCSVATGVPLNVLQMGLLRDLEVRGGQVRVSLRLTSPFCFQFAYFQEAIKKAVGGLPGVERVICEADHGLEWQPEMIDPQARARLRRLRPLAPSTSRPVSPPAGLEPGERHG
ncbi:MAG TPA: iron-sulfur cluster assembly protein [Candidatus Dormibacteraeota bacterium]|nr:iron-sulfur cluster assembly protein [Candidatus Dormibacteraeota bacterium]